MRKSHCVVALSILLMVSPLAAQGRGQGGSQKKDQGKPARQQAVGKTDHAKDGPKAGRGAQKAPTIQADRKVEHAKGKPEQPRGRGAYKAEPASEREGNAFLAPSHGHAKFKHDITSADLRPSIRKFATSSRAPERITAGALARAYARGLKDDDIVIIQTGDRIRLQNRAGIQLIDIDDSRSRNLGYWQIDPIGDELREGAPAFCRSGAGHPVWGRQWCYDKGFGLGRYRELNWGRTSSTPDIIFGRRIDSQNLAAATLISLLGNTVFDRLALHAVTLGFTEPLTGVWLGEPSGARILRLNSGGYPVAEIIDNNRDDRADVMVVALRPW